MLAISAQASAHPDSHVNRGTAIVNPETPAQYRHRLFLERWRRATPFKGGGRRWATPYLIVLCESGGDPHIGYAGAYGLISPTWAYFGGTRYAPSAGSASKRQQDLIAAKVWARNGESAWQPFESACAYR